MNQFRSTQFAFDEDNFCQHVSSILPRMAGPPKMMPPKATTGKES
jgi:hypothetical protein